LSASSRPTVEILNINVMFRGLNSPSMFTSSGVNLIRDNFPFLLKHFPDFFVCVLYILCPFALRSAPKYPDFAGVLAFVYYSNGSEIAAQLKCNQRRYF
jgi:hypothetical protein